MIDYKWKEGYKNLNLHFSFFDRVLMIDNSANRQPTNMFTLLKQNDATFEVEFYVKYVPEYAKRRFPNIYDILLSYKKSRKLWTRLSSNLTKKK